MAAAAAAQAEARLASLAGPRAASWARQGAESVVAALRILSDLTAQEIALGLGMVRERATLRPAPGIAEIAGRAVKGVITAEKILLDFAAGESAVIAEGVKEGLRLRPSLAAMADLLPKGMEQFVKLQKRVLDAAINETNSLVEAYIDGTPLMVGARMSHLTRTQIESFIETQKKLLDEVTEQVTVATNAMEEGATTPARRDRSKAVIQVMRNGIDKFIDAQKELLHLAIDQMEPPKLSERVKTPPRTSFAELTQKSVKNFATAQKSILDLALKPVKAADEEARAEAAPARKAPRRPRRKK